MVSTRFDLGDRVRLKAQPSVRGIVIAGPREGITSDLYQVFFSQERQPWIASSGLEKDIEEETLAWVGADRFLRDIAVLKLSNHFSDVLYSMGSSRTKFLVYQFQPVLKFVQSQPHGMLIADEVGLGKTIEAGLILKELIARGSVQRVLVVCPANLRQKWRSEMQQRFGLQFSEVGARELREMQRDINVVGWPAFMGVASIEGLRRAGPREIIEAIALHFDLVIIDEAHHLRNAASQSFDLGQLLSDQADHLLLLSATPVQTGSRDLLSLLQLVDPDRFSQTRVGDLEDLLAPNAFFNRAVGLLAESKVDPQEVADVLRQVLSTSYADAFRNNPLFLSCLDRLERSDGLGSQEIVGIQRDLKQLHTLAPFFTRTRKREVEATATRRSYVVRVDLTPQESRFYSAWYAYVVELAKVRTPGAPIAWVSSMRERQAASSLQAAKQALAGLLAGDPLGNELETSDPDLVGTAWATTSLSPASQLHNARKQVIVASERLGEVDSKAQRLISEIRSFLAAEADRKILVFAFFKGTVSVLKKALSRSGIKVESMSGDDEPDIRSDIVSRFRESDTNVLITTEVGSEGLDFQFCDTVINFDLPWNPMRVEQRIGRIDRYGQSRPFVNVVSFFVESTIDTKILERLYTRIKVFEESIGELEPILGPIVSELQSDVFSQELDEAEMQRRAEAAVLRAENLKLQHEAFEASRAELLGQGTLVRQEIEGMRQSGRFLSPEEIRALVADWAERSGLGTDHLRPTQKDGVWDLSLSPRKIGRIRERIQRDRRHDPAVSKLISRIQEERHAWCTFDGEIAQAFGNLPFIDVNHPITRVAYEDAKDDFPEDPYLRVGSIELDLNLPDRGVVLFLYRLAVKGMEPRETLLPVVVDVDKEEVIEDLGDTILGLLPTAEGRGLNNGTLDRKTIYRLEERAFLQADARRVEAENWAQSTEESRKVTQAASVNRTYEGKIYRKIELSRRVFDERIRRLHEGELRNLIAARESKLAEIASAPLPHAEVDLIAIAYVKAAR